MKNGPQDTGRHGPAAAATRWGAGTDAPSLLVLDTSYTFEMIRLRELEDSVLCRDLEGYFRHVWSVHPFATLLTSETWAPKYGKPVWHALSPQHSFVEGKVGRFAGLRRLFPLNFLIGQIGLFFTLLRLIRKERIRAIRVGDPLYLGLMGWGLARLSGIPFVIRVNGNFDKVRETSGQPIFPRLFPTIAIEKALERFIFKRADLVAALNDDNLNFAVANGARPERTTIFRLGSLIDRRHFQLAADRPSGHEELAQLGLRDGGFLMTVGRLEYIKHPDDTIRVLKDVRDRGFDVKLLLVGDGSIVEDLRRLAADLGVLDQVVFAGGRSQGWLARVIPHAAVVLSPSTGRALVEVALGEGAVVAYDTDWQAEMIETGVTGVLVAHRDAAAMTDAVERYLRDDVFRRAMGKALRRRAFDLLDPEAVVRHEREQYDRLLEPSYSGGSSVQEPAS